MGEAADGYPSFITGTLTYPSGEKVVIRVRFNERTKENTYIAEVWSHTAGWLHFGPYSAVESVDVQGAARLVAKRVLAAFSGEEE